jgi:uncharacterized membrane protein YkvA (DUF1232 family)
MELCCPRQSLRPAENLVVIWELRAVVKQWISRVKEWARRLKRDVVALWFACKDARTPRWAKVVAVFTVGYALSPIDLIPDFIPILGFVDDAIILPGLIWLVLRLIPPHLMADFRSKAEQWLAGGNRKPVSRAGAAAIVVLWLATAVWLWVSLGQGQSWF